MAYNSLEPAKQAQRYTVMYCIVLDWIASSVLYLAASRAVWLYVCLALWLYGFVRLRSALRVELACPSCARYGVFSAF